MVKSSQKPQSASSRVSVISERERKAELAYYKANPSAPAPIALRIRARNGKVRWPDRV